MEKIITNPGLQHLVEEVFWNLDVDALKICAQINESCKLILQNPMFCLGKFEYLSTGNRKEWIKNIQSVKNSDKGIAIISYLKWNLSKGVVDPPCYSSPAVQMDFRQKITKICEKRQLSIEDRNIVKIIAPLSENPNAPDDHEETPIFRAACKGHSEIVKILAPLTGNPNAPKNDGSTPIYWAAVWGHTEIVKILAPLTDTPNASNNQWQTPFAVAKNEEIRGILLKRSIELQNPV